MNDYLWNKTGDHDAELAELERTLASLRFVPRPLDFNVDACADANDESTANDANTNAVTIPFAPPANPLPEAADALPFVQPPRRGWQMPLAVAATLAVATTSLFVLLNRAQNNQSTPVVVSNITRDDNSTPAPPRDEQIANTERRDPHEQSATNDGGMLRQVLSASATNAGRQTNVTPPLHANKRTKARASSMTRDDANSAELIARRNVEGRDGAANRQQQRAASELLLALSVAGDTFDTANKQMQQTGKELQARLAPASPSNITSRLLH